MNVNKRERERKRERKKEREREKSERKKERERGDGGWYSKYLSSKILAGEIQILAFVLSPSIISKFLKKFRHSVWPAERPIR